MKHFIETEEECLAICAKMMKGLKGKWESEASKVDAVLRNTNWYAFISNGEVYILHNSSDGSYSAAYEGTNFELRSWNGRTPKEALRRLIRSHARSIEDSKKLLASLKKEIPQEEARQKHMQTWL